MQNITSGFAFWSTTYLPTKSLQILGNELSCMHMISNYLCFGSYFVCRYEGEKVRGLYDGDGEACFSGGHKYKVCSIEFVLYALGEGLQLFVSVSVTLDSSSKMMNHGKICYRYCFF